MLLDFNAMTELKIPCMNHGTGEMSARMYNDETLRIITCKIHPGGSIGMHSHETGDDINYILSGIGIAICDGAEEPLAPGCCHVCKKGSNHSIRNTGNTDLVMITVVVRK